MKATGKSILSTILIAAMLLSCVVSAAAVPAPYIIGDADCDYSITVLDATAIQRSLATLDVTSYNAAAADADGDGDVTVLDATEIQRYIVDLPTYEKLGAIYVAPAEEVWLDKDKATKLDFDLTEELYIREIHPDYFIADPYFPLPGVYKIHGSLSADWCIGDHVTVMITNIYYGPDSYPERYEADMVSISISTVVPDPNVAYKPVIYLYPEKETEVNVSLDLNGELLKSEPLYREGWTVTAKPDGTLTSADGRQYDYLFWEAKLNADYDLSEGFCVKLGVNRLYDLEGIGASVFLHDKINQHAPFNPFLLGGIGIVQIFLNILPECLSAAFELRILIAKTVIEYLNLLFSFLGIL